MPNFKKQTKSFFSTRELTYLALFTAACVVGRILFQFIPNFQPMSAIFLIVAAHLGIFRGVLVSILSLLITSMYMGVGIWTLEQIICYGLLICLFGFVYKYTKIKQYFFLQILLSFFVGFLYGFIFSWMDYFLYGLSTFLPYYLQGVSFDFMHALGNALFYSILFPVISRLLKRYPSS